MIDLLPLLEGLLLLTLLASIASFVMAYAEFLKYRRPRKDR